MNSLCKTVFLAIWLISMGWLISTKLWPTWNSRSAPDVAYLASSEPETSQSHWDIFANQYRIGRVNIHAERLPDTSTQVTSELCIEQIPLEQMIRRFAGAWTKYIPGTEALASDFNLSFRSHTDMRMDAGGKLVEFRLAVQMHEQPGTVVIRGSVQAQSLNVRVVSTAFELDEIIRTANDPSHDSSNEQELLQTALPYPETGIVADVLSPHPRMNNLRVGQSWQFERYQAFPPSQTLRLTEATVESQELVLWQGDVETVFVVTYRDLGKQGPTASTADYGKLWVRQDGTVLKQFLNISGVELEFRQTFASSEKAAP